MPLWIIIFLSLCFFWCFTIFGLIPIICLVGNLLTWDFDSSHENLFILVFPIVGIVDVIYKYIDKAELEI